MNRSIATLAGLLIFIGAVLVVAAATDVSAGADVETAESGGWSVQPILQYQARLRDPASGDPVADGSYTMTFRFYRVAEGGSALWTEVKDIQTQDGLFSTALGDTTPLGHEIFNGQMLWLGIKVAGDAEAAPRQQVLPVAYALSLVPGAGIQADSARAALTVNNQGEGSALQVIGALQVDGPLSVSGELRGGVHVHDGSDIATGQVAEARISPQLARDNEVATAVTDHAADRDAHHRRYTDSEAVAAALASPELVTQYELADHIAGGMHSGRYIAAGSIRQDGAIAAATSNVSCRWDSLWQHYEITIDGVDYDRGSYVTVVTPLIGIANAWSTGDGKLKIGIYLDKDTVTKSDFHFVTFQP